MNGEHFKKISLLLTHLGWKSVHSALDGKLAFFKKEDCAQLIELADDSLPGADRTQKSAMSAFSQIEGKDIESSSELVFAKEPMLQIRIPEQSGRIGIDAAIHLRRAAKQMLVSASHSIESPQIEHLRLNGRNAVSRFKNCCEKPVREGSYIARFVIPGDLDLAEMTKNAIEKTNELVRKDKVPTSSQHEDLAKNGVSANFLDAFAMFTFDQSMPEIAFTSQDSLVFASIDESFISFAKNLSSSFRTKETEKIVEASGIVTFLGWDDSDSVGSIKMRGTIDSLRPNIDFIVQTENTQFYEIARNAEFPVKKKIKVKGTYIPGTHPSRIAEISVFEVAN